MSRKMTWWLLFYGFLFALGFFLAYLGYGQFHKTKELLRSGIRTKATVHSLWHYSYKMVRNYIKGYRTRLTNSQMTEKFAIVRYKTFIVHGSNCEAWQQESVKMDPNLPCKITFPVSDALANMKTCNLGHLVQ